MSTHIVLFFQRNYFISLYKNKFLLILQLIHNALDRVNLKLMLNTTNGVYVMSGHSNRSLNLMTVPALYAFVCKRPYTISMKVKLYKFEDEEGI